MGTIVNRNGSYRAMVRLAGHEPRTKTFPTRKEAVAWVRQTETSLEAANPTNPKIKIVDLIDRYVKEIAPQRQMADSHLKHDIPSIRTQFKDMRMQDLIGNGLTEWVLQSRGRLGPKTCQWHVARLYGLLRQVEFHWGVGVPWKDMDTCKQKLIEMGYLRKPDERDRRISDAEFRAILDFLSPRSTIPLEDVLSFCLATAMRIGEVCRLRWQDLDREARTIIVRDRKHPTRKFGNHHVVPLLAGSFEIVERQRQKDGDPRIFRCTPMYVSRVFKDASRVAGLEDIRLHDLRHEGISRMFELGFQIQEVALVSGHTNWRTLARYTHLRPTALVEKERRLRQAANLHSLEVRHAA